MGGLGILIVIVLYVAIAVFVVRKISTRWGKAIAALFAVLLPTGDALWGRYVTLPKLCQDAGLKVFKKVSKADGLMYSGTPEDYFIRKFGIFFVEGYVSNERYMRLVLRDGKPAMEDHVYPQAKYILTSWKSVPTNVFGNFTGSEYRIEVRATGEILSRVRAYSFGGGWAERFLGDFADSGPQRVACSSGGEQNTPDILVFKTFE